jgi:hypothetical protein
MTPTAALVAECMLEKLEDQGSLYQDEVVDLILTDFGEEFLHDRGNGSLRICAPVLRAFRRLKGERVRWNARERLWYVVEERDRAVSRAMLCNGLLVPWRV